MKNTAVVLARRPNGKPVPEDFAVAETEASTAGGSKVGNRKVSSARDKSALPAMAIAAVAARADTFGEILGVMP